jgi:hypothetical protein
MQVTSGNVTGQDIAYYSNPAYDDRGENNYNTGNSWSNVGGVLGYGWGRSNNSSVSLKLTNISSSANVIGVNAVGGLAGQVQYGNITLSSTTGNVTSVAQTGVANVYRTGGLLGYLYSSNSEISNSSHSVGLVKGFNYVGGLAGEAYGQVGVNVSANATPNYSTFVSSNVEGNGERIGGLVGSFYSGYITNAEMSGTVTGWRTAGNPDYTNGTFTGGIGGYVTSADVKYVRFTGSQVKGSSQTGGLIGHHDNTLNNSYSTGNVTANGDYLGGAVGYGVHLNDSYATGNVSASNTFVGGLAGQAAGTINRSYATGNVTGLISGSTFNYAGTYAGAWRATPMAISTTRITPDCWSRVAIKLADWWAILMVEFIVPMPLVMFSRTRRMWVDWLATWEILFSIPMQLAMYRALTMWVDLRAMRGTLEVLMQQEM